MHPGPNGAVGGQAHAVPYDVKMLPPVLDMLDDDALMVVALVTIFLFAAFDDLHHFRIGQALALERVDADMMQGLFDPCAAGDDPHIPKGLVKILGVRIADLDKAVRFVLAYVFHILGGGSVASPDMALYDQGCGAF